jgi:hypothetical protein
MNTHTETDTREESTAIGDQSDTLASFGLIHLAACCGAGAAAVLAVILIEWLS